MKTDELIDQIALLPMPWLRPSAALLRGLAVGSAVSIIIMLTWLNLRPDLALAMSTTAFWMKLGYAAAVSIIAFSISLALSRPAGAPEKFWLLGLPFLLLSAVALAQLTSANAGEQMQLVMGHSARVCSLRIVALGIPVLVALLFAFRQLAPTRPGAAGLSAGLLAGAAGTLVYAFHCDESAAPFVAVWYTLGMASVGAIGGLLGRSLLRW